MLEPLTDESDSSRLYYHAVRLVSRVSSRKLDQFSRRADRRRSILGPTLGGGLARPALNYPNLFSQKSIWANFPYLLPNLVCTVIVSFGVVIGILFLEETHAEKKYRRDPGLEAGKWLLSKVTLCANWKSSRCEKADDSEVVSLLSNEDQPPGYCTTAPSPKLPSTPSQEPEEALDLDDVRDAPRPKPAVTKAFTRQVILNIIGYGVLA